MILSSENLAKDSLSELELLEFQIHKAEMNYHSREKDLNYHTGLYDQIGIFIKKMFNLYFVQIIISIKLIMK